MVPHARAYVLAGFKSKPAWTRPNGAKLAQNPVVAARIIELQDEFKASAALHVQYLQALLLPAAEANLVDFVTDDGADGAPRYKKLSELTREQGAAIQSITFHDDGSIADLRLVPKTDAIKTLMTSIGATGVQRHEHAVVVGLGDRLNAARQRLAKLPYDDQVSLLNALETLPAEPEKTDPQEDGASHDDGWS